LQSRSAAAGCDKWRCALCEGKQPAQPALTTPCKPPTFHARQAVGDVYRMLRTARGERNESSLPRTTFWGETSRRSRAMLWGLHIAANNAALTDEAESVGVAVVEALGEEEGVAYRDGVCTAPDAGAETFRRTK